MTRDEYAADVCKRLDRAEDIPFQPVVIGDWEPQVRKCHENVDFWVKANPGSVAVRGWVTGNRLTAHSVVQGADGRLLISRRYVTSASGAVCTSSGMLAGKQYFGPQRSSTSLSTARSQPMK